jgi:flagellar M-ring protein FliF
MSLREILEQLSSVWTQSSSAAKAGLVVAALFLMGAIVSVGLWSSQPQYIPLAAGLAPSEAAEIVSKLEAQSIKYQLNFSGSTVMVDKTDWSQARLLVDDVATFSGGSQELESSMISDPETNRFRMQHRREESLARTIRNMAGVSNASVHLAIAERSVFIRDRADSTASVVLELKSNAPFSREQASSIVSLVSGSVEGLSPKNVSVMDTRGRILSSSGGSGGDSNVSANFEFRRQFESELAAKADTMLAHLLGPSRAVVRVSADIDFTCLERTKTTFDSKQKVTKQEEISVFEKTGQQSAAGGLAGTKSNFKNNEKTIGESLPSKESEETSSTFYDTPKTVDIMKQCPGDVKRLTVAVLADLRTFQGADNPDDPEAANKQTPQLSQENVEAIVKQAVGFDEQRGDKIEVLITEFATTPETIVAPVVNDWEFYNQILRNASLGIASLVALLLGMMTLKKMRPVTIQVEAEEEVDEQEKMLLKLSERIQDNPDTMRTIISAWLSEPDDRRPSSKAA